MSSAYRCSTEVLHRGARARRNNIATGAPTTRSPVAMGRNKVSESAFFAIGVDLLMMTGTMPCQANIHRG